ncbi:MAG: extracellular solute-binding protein [Clostridia bacterium]|nr:extracellular solute-binding protein [Clostridia bacterium]
MERSFGNKYGKWIVTAVVVLALGLWFYLSSGIESYAHKYEGTDLTTGVAGIGRDNTYELYLRAHEGAADASADVEIDLSSVAAAEGVEIREQGVYTASGSEATWTVTVPESGYYNVALRYLTEESRGVDLERELRINGELPFDGADTMAFSRLWTDGGEVKMDNQGNEIRPTQVELFDLEQTALCRDAMGYITEPYRFYFEAGENTLTLKATSEPMLLTGLTLKAPGGAQSYESYIAAQPDVQQPASLKDFTRTVQGEDSVRRSSPSLYARYDRSSPATEPYDVYHTVLNYIGGDAWRDAGQWIEWDFSVPADGWYNITIKGRQTYSRGSVSSRIMYLDGEIPFAGLENVSFPYSNSWQMNTLSDANGNAYRFYLTEGKHTIRLEATLGDMGAILSDMEESIYRLNQMYRKILVLTGVTPDQYRDYHLEAVYPEVIQGMELESRLLYKLVDDAVAVTGQKSDRVAVAQTLAVQLETFVEDPAEITQAFTNFKDNITSMGTAMQNLRQIKLDIDQIIITGDGVAVKQPSENFFAKVMHELRSCIASYTVDYNALGNVYEGDETDVLEVWILTGRDQSTVLKTMVDDTFTPATGIPVNVMLVDPNALLNATVAGNGPDVVVSTDSWNPVNYALRGAAEDLTQFADLDEVLSDFYPSAYAAFEFNNGVNDGLYALPETQLCSILFYRSDILEEYGLEVPRTWDDLIAMLPTIQGANMSVGIPYPDIVAPNLSSLYSMLYQRGGALYNEKATQTTVNSEAGVQAFEMYTSLYNDYGLPTIFDFVSRFRSGEMPMGIFDYTTFNTLTVSAPEIRGLWDIAVMPGTAYTDENGNETINHAGHSQGACCMMIATDNEKIKQNAWEFMKWWVSTDSQVRFGREIEAILGSSARYATANIDAIEQLAWSEAQLDVIRDQMQVAVGFREVAGGYYTTRHLTNAVRKVTNEKTDPRETLLDYARTINEEILKKRDEFGLPLE